MLRPMFATGVLAGVSLATALAVSLPAQAATYRIPRTGSFDCRVSPMKPGVIFVRCLDMYAGTLVADSNTAYSGILVCEHIEFGNECPEVVVAKAATAGAIDSAKPLVCAVSGTVYDSANVAFDCKQ